MFVNNMADRLCYILFGQQFQTNNIVIIVILLQVNSIR